MWFDTIIIDKINLDGTLQTSHIRRQHDRIPTEKLEQIDRHFHSQNTADIGPLRIHAIDEATIDDLTSQIPNLAFNSDKSELYVQIDHFGIPVTAGYYACIFPKGWRLVEANVYDPYSNKDNPSENRSYKDVVFSWDGISQYSSAQFEMFSNRGTFSLGVIARLAPADSGQVFIEKDRSLSIAFTDERHENHPDEQLYRDASDYVIENRKQENTGTIPGISIRIMGVSFDLIEWGKYLIDKIRRP